MQAHNQGMNRRYETQLFLLQFKQFRKSDYIFRDELPRRNKHSAGDITNNYRIAKYCKVIVTGPPGALLFDVKPEIALK